MADIVTQIARELGVARPTQLLVSQSVVCQNPVTTGGRASKKTVKRIVSGAQARVPRRPGAEWRTLWPLCPA